MKKVLLIMILQIINLVSGQTNITIINSSFEGMPQQSVSPNPWINCMPTFTPDIQPGFFGVNVPPHHGNSYLGLLHDVSFNNWQEGVSQQLSSQIISGVTYNFSLYIQQSSSYSFTNDPIELLIYGGSSNCNNQELLATSGPVSYGVWTQYTLTLQPSSNYSHILLLANSINHNGGEKPYILIDAMSPITPCNMNIDSVHINHTTCGLENGKIELFANSSYHYLWGNGQSSSTLNLLSAGTYNVTVSNYNNTCQLDTSIIINPSYALSVDDSIVDVSCFGGTNGEIYISISNGTQPFQYNWSNGNNNNLVSNLNQGTYTLTITDSVLCSFEGTYQIIEQQSLTSQLTPTNATCFQNADGKIHANITGGTAPYTFMWSNDCTDSIANNLNSGIYYLTVVDAYNCSITDSSIINEPSQIQINTQTTQLLCSYSQNGAIYSQVQGGTQPYTYYWNNGAQSSNIFSLSSGTYHLTVADINNCIQTNYAVISAITPPIIIELFKTDNKCFGETQGELSIHVTGGKAPYLYEWSNQKTDSIIMNLPNGLYSVLVKDSNLCQEQATVEIQSPGKLCIGLPDSITLCVNQLIELQSSVTGGVSPYKYEWSTSDLSPNLWIQVESNEVISLRVEDTNHCKAESYIRIDTFKEPNLFVSFSNDTVCPNQAIEINASSVHGKLPYTFFLNGIATQFPTQVIPYGYQNFEILVTDGCGRNSKVDTNLYAINLEQLNIISDQISGCVPLQVKSQININPENNIAWHFQGNQVDNISFGNQIIHIFENEGTYNLILTVKTINNCIVERVIPNYITVYPKPEADFIAHNSVNSIISNEVYFENTTQNSSNYLWDFGDGNNNTEVSPLHIFKTPGIYNTVLTTTNSFSCSDTVSYNITILDIFEIWIPTAFTPNGDNNNDYFCIKGNGVSDENYLLTIFDRWGEAIFESHSINVSWCGKSGNGDFVPNGAYAWTLVCYDFNGIKHEKSDIVNIIK